MRNPVTVASGTFGFGQEMADFYDLCLLGAIVVKGTSLEPWPGNPYPRTCETPSGMLNAIGLQNDGLEVVPRRETPLPEAIRRAGDRQCRRAFGRGIRGKSPAALDKAEGIAGLEINVSCPNVKEGCMVFGTTPEGTARGRQGRSTRDRPHRDHQALAQRHRRREHRPGRGRRRLRRSLAHQHPARHRNRPLEAQVQARERHRRPLRPRRSSPSR